MKKWNELVKGNGYLQLSFLQTTIKKSSKGTKCNNTGLPRVAEALAEVLSCV